MRAMMFAVLLAMLPAVANAQTDNSITTEPVAPSGSEATTGAGSPAETAPMPSGPVDVDGYHIAAIAAGAVGGVIVANIVTGGMATPFMTGATLANGVTMVANGATWLASLSELAVTGIGAIGGGYVGDWLYNQ